MFYDNEFFAKRLFLKEIAEAFQEVEENKIKSLNVSMPPRAGKSYITSLFWDTWVQSNAFASQQCFGDENPNFAHKAYEYDYEVGLKEYGIDKKELESIMEEINYSKNFMDYPSYQAGRKVSAQYSLKVITNSCD